jgi:stearoyl-CoA desaturase (delta-9 desaturase)
VQKKQLNLSSVIILGGLHLVAFLVLVNLIWHQPSAKVWLLVVVLWVISGMSVTVGYHRLETHRGYQCNSVLRAIMLVCATLSLQGSAKGWVSNHWAHHRLEDEPGLDPHTPREYRGWRGFWWSHVGWLLYKPMAVYPSGNLEADRLIMWQRGWYPWIAPLAFIIPWAIAGWDGLLVAGVLRVVIGLNVTWSVNSVCHLWGSRAKDSQGNVRTTDESRNNLLVAMLGFGEGYHANHHAKQVWAYHGWHWYSFDPTKWAICSLELVGLVRNVKKPRAFTFPEREYTPT